MIVHFGESFLTQMLLKELEENLETLFKLSPGYIKAFDFKRFPERSAKNSRRNGLTDTSTMSGNLILESQPTNNTSAGMMFTINQTIKQVTQLA